ncbi:transposase [Streptomyces sp. CB00455]|uniref:transposase n=1 Tax=Streptomyces sp. CB00455 TaxID=1703927 RepID=UPI001F5BC509|nr:transposase [Streptomyces sp. CB00455]
MTDAEWAAVRPLLPVPAWVQGRGGQPEGYCHRQMLDAIRYLVADGISWRAMPVDLPGWGRVYAFFRRWREHGLITEFHDRLRGRVREREGREAEPTAGIIDAQSVKAAASVPSVSRGWDGGKKVGGRKRHIVTDCLGLLLVVAVTAANVGAPGRRPALNIPDVSCTSHPRSARRLAFARTPSTFADVVPRPSSAVISLAFVGPWPVGRRSSSMSRIRW